MENIIYVVTFIFFCIGVVALYLAIRARKRAIREQEKIQWVFEEANRALTLIESGNPSEIIVGLQMLSVFDIPSIHVQASTRLVDLSQNDNKQIAQLAKHIIQS